MRDLLSKTIPGTPPWSFIGHAWLHGGVFLLYFQPYPKHNFSGPPFQTRLVTSAPTAPLSFAGTHPCAIGYSALPASATPRAQQERE